MHKENKRKILQDETLKQHPFTVPEGYFENFAGRLNRRIREEEEKQVPVRRLRSPDRFRVAMAAAVILLALVSYPIIRLITSSQEQLSDFPDLVLLDEMNIIEEDLYLMELMENGTVADDEEEIYLNQAMEHLALNEVELDIISE